MSPSAVRFAHSAEVCRNVRAVSALRRARSRLSGDAPSPWRKTRIRPARSRTATDTRGVHSFSAVSAITNAILIEMFFSESTCAPADEDNETSAAKPITRLNRTDIESSFWLPLTMRDYVTFVRVMTVVDDTFEATPTIEFLDNIQQWLSFAFGLVTLRPTRR